MNYNYLHFKMYFLFNVKINFAVTLMEIFHIFPMKKCLKMGKSKIATILTTFSVTEMQHFRDFVASPYFNKKEELVRLLDLLAEDGADDRSKKTLYQGLFPKKPYDDKHFRYLTSDLSKLAERFMVLRRLDDDPLRAEFDLLDAYLNRGLDKYYLQVRKKIRQQLEKADFHDGSYFLHQLRLADIDERRFGEKLQRRFDLSIQYASNYLDCYYFTKKLKYSCDMLDRQALLQGEYQLNLSPGLIDHLKKNEFFQQDLIALYHTVLIALQEEDKEAHFSRLKALLISHSEQIAPAELKEFYFYGINYCARKIRQGKEKYVTEALDLYMDGIDQGILIEKNHLTPWTFTNIVKLALRLKRYAWIETFIHRYADMLPAEFRQNALHYNLAELFYYTQDYDQALDHLNKVKWSDLNFYLGARVILAKVYYETGEEEALLSLIASFTIFLKRNKEISNQLKKTYLNFCEILFQLMKRKKRKLEPLREKIQKTELLTDRAWLGATLEEMSRC